MELNSYLGEGVCLRDRYHIVTVLGAGGFVITYKAWDRIFQKYVCVKEYYPFGIANRNPSENKTVIYTNKNTYIFTHGRELFLKEARDFAQFKSVRGIVNVFDFFEENQTAYMVVEFLEGQTLKMYLNSYGNDMGEDLAIHIVCSVLDALKNVHAAGIIHRNISPDNIFLCQDMSVKLIGFDVASKISKSENQMRSVVLNSGFTPPELYSKKMKQGPWTDIYALGATMYRMLTDRMPEESVNRLVNDELVPPDEINPEISKKFNDIIMKAMSLKSQKRFQNTEQFMRALGVHRDKKGR